jgi:hypothetical protein
MLALSLLCFLLQTARYFHLHRCRQRVLGTGFSLSISWSLLVPLGDPIIQLAPVNKATTMPTPKPVLDQIEVARPASTAIARAPEEGDPAWGQLHRYDAVQPLIIEGGEPRRTFLHKCEDKEFVAAAHILTTEGHQVRVAIAFQGAAAALKPDHFCRLDAWGFLYRVAHVQGPSVQWEWEIRATADALPGDPCPFRHLSGIPFCH